MRLRKSALVIIVVIMVAATGFLSVQMFSWANYYRNGYVAAVADRTVFAEGEGVTFELRSLTPDVPFSLHGNVDGSGIYIYRIPSGVTPEEYLQSLSGVGWLENPGAWGRVTFDSFSQTDQPLRLTWNGTYEVAPVSYGEATEYYRATAGYYLLFPRFFTYEMGSPLKPRLDLSSIFYYDALIEAACNATAIPESSSLIADISLRLSEGNESLTSCALECSQQDWGESHLEYYNFTVDLGADHWTNVTFVVSGSIDYTWSKVVRAILSSSSGDYLFGFVVQWNGGTPSVWQF